MMQFFRSTFQSLIRGNLILWDIIWHYVKNSSVVKLIIIYEDKNINLGTLKAIKSLISIREILYLAFPKFIDPKDNFGYILWNIHWQWLVS